MFRAWLEIARLSNLPTAWSNMLAAWILAGGKWEIRAPKGKPLVEKRGTRTPLAIATRSDRK